MENKTDLEASHLAIIQSLKDGVIVRDLNGVISFANEAALKLFGYTHEEMIGKNIDILMPESKKNEEKRMLENILWGHQIDDYETERIGKNKETIYVYESLAALKGETGKIVGITKAVRNITHKKKAEAKFQSLLESAPDAMVIVNKFGQIILVNAQTEKLFGYSRADFLGQQVEMLIPKKLMEAHIEHRKKFIAQPKARAMGAHLGLGLYGRKKDGTEFPAEISLGPINTEDGLLVCAAIRDISSQKQTELQLKDYARRLEISNKELEQFAYVASHDLCEPMRTIANYAQLLNGKLAGGLDPEGQLYMNFISGSATRMLEMVRDLLQFSRVGQGFAKDFIDCNIVLSDTLKELDLLIKENQAEIILESLPKVWASPVELSRVFQNLISNAIKFKKPGRSPEIFITCREAENEYIFAVKDNGIGIEERFFDRLFVIFRTLHTATEYPGTGIGLAICKKIIELHGGRIWIESEYGKGSTFYFSLPKTTDPAKQNTLEESNA